MQSAMNILVLYSTTEGQTKKVAGRIAAISREAGHEAVLRDMASDQPTPPLGSFDAVICAASVHQGYHQVSAIDFVSAYASELNERLSAFVSISLSAAVPEGEEEARRYVAEFSKKTGWKPAKILLVGGALHPAKYDYFEQEVVKNLLRQKGVADDMMSDYECTDWGALETFVRSFVDSAEQS